MRYLVATQAFRYDGKELEVGDDFQASDNDAKVLEALGRAKPGAGKPRAAQKTRALKAQSDTAPASKIDDMPESGRYHRSDMRAED